MPSGDFPECACIGRVRVFAQERWCGGGAFDFQPHQGVGTQGAGTELDAHDPGIWLVLQSHHGAGAGADLPGAVPVARRGRPRGPAEHLRDVDEGDCPAGDDAAAGGCGEADR